MWWDSCPLSSSQRNCGAVVGIVVLAVMLIDVIGACIRKILA
jgi:hypothetical protein